MINSGRNYIARRTAIRNSWLKYLSDPGVGHHRVEVKFVLGRKASPDAVALPDQTNSDLLELDVEDSYATLLQKLLLFMKWAHDHFDFRYLMHCDDDSFIRLDLLMGVITASSFPRERLYWGYIWDNLHTRITKPLRDPAHKSYMPLEHYPLDCYPPFASGCAFLLSHDIISYLVANRHWLRDYRLIDVGVGIWLYPLQINPMNEDRVRPYRPLPLYRSDTLVQHYMQPEEFAPFYAKATSKQQTQGDDQAAALYNVLAAMKLLKK